MTTETHLEISITDRPFLLEERDIGKIALYDPNGGVLAVCNTLAECVAECNRCCGQDCQRDDDAEGGWRELREDDVCTSDDWDLSQLCAAVVTA